MVVQVNLYGNPIGTVDWDQERGVSIFQYTESSYSNAFEPSPIVMPKEARTYITTRDHLNFNNLPFLLSDSMPDDFGNTMMKEWLRQNNLIYGDINPVDRLTYVGQRGMGALEFFPVNHKSDSNYNVNVSELLEVAKEVLKGKENSEFGNLDKEGISNILRIGTSVGGARAKALIALKEEEGKIIEIKPGDIAQPEEYPYWLLKFDGANEDSLGESEGIGKIEFAYYTIARNCGIQISESRLYSEGERHHFLTKRFDRTDSGEKIHMQTLGALLGIDFKQQRASSYETLFRTMKRLNLTYGQFEQQYRRAIFNVVARNHDDHVKNFSFLMDRDGKWSISPAYDLTYSYKPGGRWTDVHQSSLNGKFSDFMMKDLIQFGQKYGIKKAKHIIEETIHAVSEWSRVADDLGIPKDRIDEIGANLRLKVI